MAEDVRAARAAPNKSPDAPPAYTGPGAGESTPDSSASAAAHLASLTGYIEPPRRQLGPHKHALHEPQPSLQCVSPVDFHLRKLVGLVVASGKHHPKFTAEFLDETTQLAAQFMSYFVDSLHKLTEVQRHRRPGIADLEMCLAAQNVAPSELHEEYVRTQKLDAPARRHADRVDRDLQASLRAYHAGNYTLDKDDPSLVFHANEQHEIASIVPRQATPRAYIPPYLPDLPPDFTFTSTGHYMQTTTDLKQIKLRLAEESRLNEASLYRLIDDDERRWKEALEADLARSAASDSDSHADETAGAAGTPGPAESPPEKSAPGSPQSAGPAEPTHVADTSGKRFDFVAYAHKRRAARERHARETARRRRLRQSSLYMKAEAAFSPYANAPASGATRAFFDGELERSFQRVIRATRVAEQQKKQRLAELAEERRRREEAQAEQNGAFDFGFSFNPAANLSDDSDDEDRAETTAEFDFGDAPEAAAGANEPARAPHDAPEHSVVQSAESPEPRAGQVSGKAPLKGPSGPNYADQDMSVDLSDGHGDLEDELEQHFGLEPEGGSDNNGLGQGITMRFDEPVPGVQKDAAVERAAGTASGEPEEKSDPAAHVSWGDLGSGESEEDELEDV